MSQNSELVPYRISVPIFSCTQICTRKYFRVFQPLVVDNCPQKVPEALISLTIFRVCCLYVKLENLKLVSNQWWPPTIIYIIHSLSFQNQCNFFTYSWSPVLLHVVVAIDFVLALIWLENRFKLENLRDILRYHIFMWTVFVTVFCVLYLDRQLNKTN